MCVTSTTHGVSLGGLGRKSPMTIIDPPDKRLYADDENEKQSHKIIKSGERQ